MDGLTLTTSKSTISRWWKNSRLSGGASLLLHESTRPTGASLTCFHALLRFFVGGVQPDVPLQAFIAEVREKHKRARKGSKCDGRRNHCPKSLLCVLTACLGGQPLIVDFSCKFASPTIAPWGRYKEVDSACCRPATARRHRSTRIHTTVLPPRAGGPRHPRFSPPSLRPLRKASRVVL